ncbi:MAG: hypothetical protein REH83_06640, partial [Rickettsiella sp.]|nr:hypothetical protein [Rickettsiella sp.]
AMQSLAANKRILQSLLSLHKKNDLKAIWDGVFFSQQQEIVNILSIKKFIDVNIAASYLEVLNYSLSKLENLVVNSVSVSELRLYHLRDVLNNWINWERSKLQLRDPLQVLNAVMTHYERPFPFVFFQQAFDVDLFPNVRFLDEAALVWNQLSKNDIFKGIKENGTLSSYLLEDNYFNALSKVYHKQKIIDKLFLPTKINNSSKVIYFNGLAFKNAQGKHFSDLINCTELESIPEYKNLTFYKQYELLKEKFYQIGESIEYNIGSLFHSLDSTLIRIYYYQVAAYPFHHNQKTLIDLFKRTEEQWVENKKYPIHPRLLLALHLAESNNVIFSDKDWKVKLKKLFEYLANEFEKILLTPPQFDRVKATVAFLESKGMSLQEINQKRYYVIDADDPNLSMTYFGTPLEQFLRITDWDGIMGRTMYYLGVKIEPRKVLQDAEERFNAQLYQDPWLQNKAKDNLKHQSKNITFEAIELEAKRIAKEYEVESENHRAWIRGLKTWVSTIPIIGPLYAIEEGIRDKDAIEIISGIFFLSMDAMDFLTAETTPRSARLSVRERVTIDATHTTFKKLNLSPADLPLDDRIQLIKDPFAIEESNVVPSTYQLTAEQVRSGVQGLSWREYPIVHLFDENRVVPVKSEGGAFREINWHTGEVDPKKHLIFKDRETGKYFSSTASLKGGTPDSLPLSEEELRQRLTVKETEEIFNKANEYLTFNFDALFNQCFYTQEYAGASLFNMRQFYKLLYKQSPSFRRIFNRYHETFVAKGAESQWGIVIESNTKSRADFNTKTIYIASDDEISKIYYLSDQNSFESSRPEQIYLHEILHALTGKTDPIKSIDIRHRGAIVYLTDKILNEAGYIFPQRIMYRRLSKIGGSDDLDKLDFQWEQHRDKGRLLVAQENEYLDNLINRQIPLTEYKKVFGKEISTRYTITELESLWERLNIKQPFNIDAIFEERLEKYFTAKNDEIFNGLKSFYTNFYVRSSEFSNLFDVWCSQLKVEEPIQKWYFELDANVALEELPIEKQVHCINDLTKKIYIFDDGTLYLTAKGLLPVERTRQLVHEMVQVLTGLKDPPPSIAFKNRGGVVAITDKILEQAKLVFDKRLVYALVKDTDVARQSVLLNNQIETARVVQLEDMLLKNIRKSLLECVGCIQKRSIEKEIDLFNTPSTKKHLPQKPHESLFFIEKRIKQNLKENGIAAGTKYLNDQNVALTKYSQNLSAFFARNPLSHTFEVYPANEIGLVVNHSLNYFI